MGDQEPTNKCPMNDHECLEYIFRSLFEELHSSSQIEKVFLAVVSRDGFTNEGLSQHITITVLALGSET